MPTATGPIRPGRLFRSGAPDRDPGDLPDVVAGGLRLAIDLRSVAERSARPARWPAGVRVKAPNAGGNRNVGDPAGLAASCGVSPAATIEVIRGVYAAMPETQGRAFAAVFAALAAGDGPLLVHCAVGKDRTGGAVAILLDALGTPRDVILADYLASNQASTAIAAAFEGDPRTAGTRAEPRVCWHPLLVADARYLAALFERLDAAGGAPAYVRRACGPDGIARIARHLTG